jgi:hypothetical protein
MNLALLRVDTTKSESGMEIQVNKHPRVENLTTRHMYVLKDPPYGNRSRR